MSHLPFIIGSYAVAVVVLGWCALAPVLRTRRVRARLRARQRGQS